VALLAGGRSTERAVSLASGARVAEALRVAGHQVTSVDPAETRLARFDWSQIDICFLALHGGAGEDGCVQRWLARRSIPYTGSGPSASWRAMHKSIAKQMFLARGVATPEFALLPPEQTVASALESVRAIGFPLVVKPQAQGSSLGVSVVHRAGQFCEALFRARRLGPRVLAERWIAGRELTVAVLGRKPLPVLEIVGQGEVFDYRSKYASAEVKYHFRTGLGPMKLKELGSLAVAAAAALRTAGLVRVDLRLDPALRPWVLEINTLPGMTAHSLAPRIAAEAGIDMPALCDWMLQDGLRRSRRRVGSRKDGG
jgi:D-alanine-D-alanine ligase